MTPDDAIDLTRLSFSYTGSFTSLLPLGTLTLSSFHGIPSPAPNAPDGFYWAPPLPWITSPRRTLESDLEFLSANDFIRGTYRMIGPGMARVRIYVLAEDAEWYEPREMRVELRGRALLKKIWGMVDTNPRSWNSEGGTGNEWEYQYANLDSPDEGDSALSLSNIFNSLPSPTVDTKLMES